MRVLCGEERDAVRDLARPYGAANGPDVGSVPRGEAMEESDVDMVPELEPDRWLLDHVGLVFDLLEKLGAIVGAERSFH